ncbi:MAG TPA: hypothetical protein VJT84_09495 [Gaiellaceae bacterium]|nr:hypothetical protein [Gaiellaceae bacterium]
MRRLIGPALLLAATVGAASAATGAGPKRLFARAGSVYATVSYVERKPGVEYTSLRVKIDREGRTVLDAPIATAGCRPCGAFKPVALRVRDLDGGEPEVLFDMYTGGAHCCSALVVFRFDTASGRYRPTFLDFGNYGYRLVDLNHDGVPEFSHFDERFVYTFTAYVFSAAPIQISTFRAGRLAHLTRFFPAQVREDAASLWRTYLKQRDEPDVDMRAYVAAYVADQFLLGRSAEAQRALDLALRRGDLGTGKQLLGLPAGKAFVATLLADLRKWGYIRSS